MKTKIEALKKVIHLILNGEKMSPSMLMTVIRFVMPLQVIYLSCFIIEMDSYRTLARK